MVAGIQHILNWVQFMGSQNQFAWKNSLATDHSYEGIFLGDNALTRHTTLSGRWSTLFQLPTRFEMKTIIAGIVTPRRRSRIGPDLLAPHEIIPASARVR